ncbi:MAG: glycosyltransferase family 87 protein [Candidatus Omnitrophica bacterium]|nr:glycosyltransferase family 87 protein [Candidatus Omnitrophota bacterium]
MKGIKMDNQRRAIYVVFAVLVAVFVFLSYFHEVIKMSLYRNFGDLGNYYFYSKALNLNYNVYSMDNETTEQLRKEFGMPPFIAVTLHSPAFLIMIKWITFFEYNSATIVWMLVNNILLLLSICIILKMAFEKIKNIDKGFVIASSAFLVFSFQPLLENTVLGQINPMIFFFFVLSLYCLDRKNEILSGIVLSLGILIKPHFGILLLFFLWKRCYRVFFSAAASLVLFEALPILLGKIAAERSYFAAVIDFLYRNLTDTTLSNLSLAALINRINGTGGIILTILVILCAYAAYITRERFRGSDLRFLLEFSLMLPLIFLIFPVVHEHHYILLYLPIILLWARLNKEPKLIPTVLFALSFLLIGLRYSLIQFPAFGSGFLSVFSGLKIYGVIMLFFLIAHEIGRKEE